MLKTSIFKDVTRQEKRHSIGSCSSKESLQPPVLDLPSGNEWKQVPVGTPMPAPPVLKFWGCDSLPLDLPTDGVKHHVQPRLVKEK